MQTHLFLATFVFSAISLIALHSQIVYVCTFLHNFLPPWEVFNDYPQIQKPYKVVVYVIGYGAGNARSTVWGQISTANGTKISDVVTKNGH